MKTVHIFFSSSHLSCCIFVWILKDMGTHSLKSLQAVSVSLREIYTPCMELITDYIKSLWTRVDPL